MKIRDKDGNVGDVGLAYPYLGTGESIAIWGRKTLVSISAHGLWLTPAQARRFAKAILRAADTASKERDRMKASRSKTPKGRSRR
jgi:hypothetical protein